MQRKAKKKNMGWILLENTDIQIIKAFYTINIQHLHTSIMRLIGHHGSMIHVETDFANKQDCEP